MILPPRHSQAHAALARALCRFSLAVVLGLALSAHAQAFDIVNRWGATQQDGGGLQRGDATRLRWSIVPDGKSYSRSSNSNLIQFLDDAWFVPAAQRTPDFTARPWFTAISGAYAQYARVSGVTLTYVAEQTAAGVSTGLSGDVRIGGENLDGTPGGALADNTFPDDGDMRIDTTRESNGSIGFYFSTEPGLRNLVIHETGHGVGLGHAQFLNDSAHAVMEGGLRTDIWGLQFDDAYALNRQYGDPKESGAGNGSPNTATPLGSFTTAGAVSVGTDAKDSVVDQFDDDWLGIDGLTDVDWFRFTVTGETFANIKLSPIGPTYETPQQGVFNAAAQSDLVLRVYSASPSVTQIVAKDLSGLGIAEQVGALHISTAGDYLIRINGKQDLNQFYQLDLSLSSLPAAGTSADLNLDNLTNLADWSQFLATSYTSLAGQSQRDAFTHGDLDHDGDSDFADFRFFKAAYNLANGAGAFEALQQIPEPATLLFAMLAIPISAGALRRGKVRRVKR